MGTPSTRGFISTAAGAGGGFQYNAIPGTDEGGGYGWGVALDFDSTGTIMVIGDTNGDEVTTWDYTGGAWVERSTSPIFGSGFRDFGQGVAISDDGTVLAVGEPSYDTPSTNVGRVRIYDYNGGTGAWDFRNEIVGGSASDFMGYSVGLNGAGTKLFVGYRNGSSARIRVYDWVDPNWVEDGTALLGPPTGTAFTYARWFARNLSVTSDGTSMIASYGGDISANSSTAAGVWDLSGSTWTRRGGEIITRLTDKWKEQVCGIHITNDGNRVYIYYLGMYYSWSGQIEVYDWVDPNWVYNATESQKYGLDETIASDGDYDDTIGLWVSADESLTALMMLDTGREIRFWGNVATGVCITKTQDFNEVVELGTYCIDSVPPPYPIDTSPPNIPRPPWTGTFPNEEENTNCAIDGFYDVLEATATEVNGNEDYVQWLSENQAAIKPTNGICD